MPSFSSSPIVLLSLIALTVLSLLSAHAQAASFPHLKQRRAQGGFMQQPQLPSFNRHMRSNNANAAGGMEVVKESDLDPALQELTTEELYRMLELIELMENKKVEKVSQRELEQLDRLMNIYSQM